MTHAGDDPVVTVAELEDLAARARALGEAIEAAGARLRAVHDSPGRAGWRLDEAAGATRGVIRELTAAAGDLAPEPGHSICPITWGVCPEHGKTLTGTAGRSWCRHPGCGRSWHYDRTSLACTEPVAFQIRTESGDGVLMCRGHAVSTLEQQADAVLTPVSADHADEP
ncbi:hypothetical protein E1212_16510 [Jiangella ureilytica]|uniref:Uncharacterized protein n=1 Tax=Jiangella ureilytica TaxID=2530374 RepID=A0A4R4RMX1_9ACTN|nr:hypothetical protein [Jiangella ureilytica]TDC50022.1 hypothetical protein E1212_16510 [Jiangella ureilytica]